MNRIHTNFLWRVRFAIQSSIFACERIHGVHYHTMWSCCLFNVDNKRKKQMGSRDGKKKFSKLFYRKYAGHMHTKQQPTKNFSLTELYTKKEPNEKKKTNKLLIECNAFHISAFYKFVDLFNYVDIFNHWIIFLRCISISRHIYFNSLGLLYIVQVLPLIIVWRRAERKRRRRRTFTKSELFRDAIDRKYPILQWPLSYRDSIVFVRTFVSLCCVVSFFSSLRFLLSQSPKKKEMIWIMNAFCNKLREKLSKNRKTQTNAVIIQQSRAFTKIIIEHIW